jgi:anti-anti-sigma factor
MTASLRKPHRRATLTVHLTDPVLAADSFTRRLVPLAVEARASALHLNLAAVELPTAGGLGQLVALAKELRAAGVTFVLRNVKGLAYEVFEVTGLTRVLDVRPG